MCTECVTNNKSKSYCYIVDTVPGHGDSELMYNKENIRIGIGLWGLFILTIGFRVLYAVYCSPETKNWTNAHARIQIYAAGTLVESQCQDSIDTS